MSFTPPITEATPIADILRGGVPPDPYAPPTDGAVPPARRPVRSWSNQLFVRTSELPQDLDPTLAAFCLQTATEIMWALSGRRFGYEQATVRPVVPEALPELGNWPWLGYFWPDSALTLWPRFWMLPIAHGPHSQDRSSEWIHQIDLAKRPVVSVDAVMVDGQELPGPAGIEGSAYRVDSWRYLVRTDGQPWPHSQDMTLDDSHVGTWSVAYTWGVAPPAAGQLAVAQFAGEIVKACVGASGCQLPQHVQTITRQGVTVAFHDLFDFLDKGRTGLYLCDVFLAAFNRQGLRSRSKVYNPERYRAHRRVNT